MNSDNIEVYLDESGGYIESLIKSRKNLIQSGGNGSNTLLTKLDLVIEVELELALMVAEKAKSEILKKQDKDKVVRPIK